MPPKTRAKKRKNEAQAVQAAGQQDQQLNQSGSQPRKQEVKKRGKPRAKGQAKAQATKQRKQSLGKKATPNNQGAAVENQKPPQEGPTSTRQSRESRTGTWHPRRRSGNPQDHTSLQHVRSRIRKKSIPQRQGFKLPRFDVPYWKIRAGVPTMVLRLLASGTETDAANVHQDDAEEMEIDSESYEDVPSGDDKRDAPPKGPPPQIDPPPPQEGPTPRPSPPSVRQLGDRADFPIHVDSQARTPPPTDFPKYPEDSPEYDVAPLTFPNMGFAGEEEIEKWGSRMARFIHSPASDLDLDTVGWHGIKPLGKGSFGMAGLWERKDIDGEVIDVGCCTLPP